MAAIVLALSTSTPRGSVALARAGEVLAASAYLELRAHAGRLFASIDEVCARAGVDKSRIDAIACDVGPGSFTGVRVAVAAANGIAMALHVPAVGITSLEAMASAARASNPTAATVHAAVDAHKDELYLGTFARDVPPVLACVSRLEGRALLEQALRSGDVVIGSIIEEALGLSCSMRSPEVDLPDAAFIARAAAGLVTQVGSAAFTGLEPIYVRPPDAKPSPEPPRIAGSQERN